jgi:two-component system chemotaxis sensor kinase CheA
MDDLLREFLTETTDQIADLDGTLKKFAANPADARLQVQIQQLFHTIKAAGGFLALPRLEAIAGAAERYFTGLKGGMVEPVTATPELVSDTIRQIVTLLEVTAKSESEPVGADTELLATLAQAAAGELKTKTAPLREPDPVAEQLRKAAPGSSSVAPSANLPETLRLPKGGALALVADGIEEITDLVGALVLTRNNLNYLIMTRDDPELEEPVRQLDFITSDLGQRVFETRELTASGASAFNLIAVVAVECAGGLFALPRANVVELSSSMLQRDYLLDLRRDQARTTLASLLGRPMAPKRGDITVVIESDGRRGSVLVERATAVEEMVVRPMPPLLGGISLYSGVGLFGDGRVALMLDPAEIVRSVEASAPLAIAKS